MDWDQIERKWSEMTNRMRADLRVPAKKDRIATAAHRGSVKAELTGAAHTESALAAEQVTTK